MLLLWLCLFVFNRRRRGPHCVDLIGHAAKGSLVGFVVGKEVFEVHVEAGRWAARLHLCEVVIGVSRGIALHVGIQA
jgi:hypothetical protein